MVSPEMMQFVGPLLAAVAFAAIVFAIFFPMFSGSREADKRIQHAGESRVKRATIRAEDEVNNNRKKAVADTLKDLEQRKAKEKVTLRQKMEQAGLEPDVKNFWMASGICGAVCAGLSMVLLPGMIPAALAIGFVGTFGLPKWLLNRMIKGRQKKFLSEFANAIDVIVRGVKSGLPLNECLGIIARESPEPISGEFREVVDQQRVGVPLGEALERMMVRVPLPEVKFFAIVIAIQQQAGGNLSEALGNLSGVLRDRQRIQMKVAALSAEAKASAGVLAALPPVVMILVYLSSPKYIALLWTTKAGQFFLLIGGALMVLGILVMRKMINFKY